MVPHVLAQSDANVSTSLHACSEHRKHSDRALVHI